MSNFKLGPDDTLLLWRRKGAGLYARVEDGTGEGKPFEVEGATVDEEGNVQTFEVGTKPDATDAGTSKTPIPVGAAGIW